MTAGTTPAGVVNQALGQIAAQIIVTGNPPTFDGNSEAALVVGLYYPQVVNLVLRQQDWEFSRIETSLGVVIGVTAPFPWTATYAYPSDCMRIRQLLPGTWLANDPKPIRWSEQWIQNPSPQRVIYCSLPIGSQIVYTTNLVTEAVWDSVFEEAVIRLLASVLALALSGRPDLAAEKLKEAGQLTQIGGGMDS